MNVTKIIKATAVRGRTSTAAPIIKEDYGLYLLIGGIDLPEVYEVDFSNDEHAGASVTMVGNADGVLIPTQFIKSGKDVFAFYYHTGEDFGRTLYTIRIPNKLRPDRTNEAPTPEEQSVIDQAINALNTAVAKTAQDVVSADQSARSASGDADRAERARTGAETAQGKAEEAQESAERAKDDAETSERNASESERKAKGYAETAGEKADSIHSMAASAQTLPAGSSASASYNAETGVMSFGIPKGKDGRDGTDGTDGTDGIDGVSPTVSVTDITGGHRVVITDKDGAKSFDVEDGATGATPNLTIGTVETLDPTDDATATITGTPENPVLNLGIPQGDAGEVTLADLNTALIEKAPVITDTASGAIASFSDGADNLPLKSLVVNIDPVQDLHGQDSPYPAGGGKNLLYVPNPETITINGVTWTCNQDGSITISGTATDASTYRYISGGGVGVSFDGDYKFVCFGSNIPIATFHGGIQINAWVSVYGDRTTAITGASGQIQQMWFQVKAGQTLNTTIYPMIYMASESAPTAWSPYENICPISGWTSVDVEQSGVNVWDEEWELGTLSTATGQNAVSTTQIRSKNYISVKPSETYYNKGYALTVYQYGVSKDFLEYSVKNVGTFTLRSDCHFIRFWRTATTYNHDISINYPSTDHDYHPYTGRSITISLGQTVYGAKLYPLEGKAVVDMAMVDLGTLTWNIHASVTGRFFADMPSTAKPTGSYNVASANICTMYRAISQNALFSNTVGIATHSLNGRSVFVYDPSYSTAAEFKTAMNGVQLCYELATPLEIQLSANQINSLLGVNNIWADSGDTEVEYRADTKLFIERLTAPDSADMIADANITSGQYFMVGNSLYKATANIANGSAIIVGTNAVRKSLSEALNEINT